jgi:hypothetical protein
MDTTLHQFHSIAMTILLIPAVYQPHAQTLEDFAQDKDIFVALIISFQIMTTIVIQIHQAVVVSTRQILLIAGIIPNTALHGHQVKILMTAEM